MLRPLSVALRLSLIAGLMPAAYTLINRSHSRIDGCRLSTLILAPISPIAMTIPEWW
ncbi:hypothetical protein MesoLj131c_67170 (plasmid) [Mesorhizobium sp. 131-3-5]|nr:hypothetical protein MesoLj131c_67170 [Mesorhizobium sp. 131-3-5]